VGLEDLAFGGWTGGLSRGVLGILRWTRNHLTFNYGLSIILITVLLRVLTHPLNKKQMQSTEKMKMLQPMVENLKAKHKDDPQKLQQETWKLYKQHKVNPLGGCLPLLLTMPIFIALWTCFRNAIELRGESFLWIGDLSRPDTLLSIPLPFVIPLIGQGHHLPINLLPLIYGVVSILQQKRMATSPSASPMMKYLPVMFIFIFYSFPAGVMLYLFFSNLLMVGSQIFHEKYGKKTAIQEVDNERSRRNGKDKRRGHTKGPRKATNNPR